MFFFTKEYGDVGFKDMLRTEGWPVACDGHEDGDGDVDESEQLVEEPKPLPGRTVKAFRPTVEVMTVQHDSFPIQPSTSIQ